jgi:hypothetical protein
MRVTYDLYAWDAANPTNKISTRSEDVVVPARASYELTYMIDAATLPVYYLTITAEPVGTLKDASIFSEKTISHIRLMVNGVSRPRLNFIGVDTYPLQAGKEATLVTCFHNTSGETDSRITKIETILYDQNKKELSRIVYEGKIIPDISGLIHKFTPSKESSQFTIVSKMSDAQGTVLDTVEKIYTCQDINPQICPPTQPVSPPASHLPSSIVLVIGGILFLLLIGLGIVLYRRKNRNTLNT